MIRLLRAGNRLVVPQSLFYLQDIRLDRQVTERTPSNAYSQTRSDKATTPLGPEEVPICCCTAAGSHSYRPYAEVYISGNTRGSINLLIAVDQS